MTLYYDLLDEPIRIVDTAVNVIYPEENEFDFHLDVQAHEQGLWQIATWLGANARETYTYRKLYVLSSERGDVYRYFFKEKRDIVLFKLFFS